MKILHIWDQAGVACILARQHRAVGHEVSILKRSGFDPFGIFGFYREYLVDMDGKNFLKYAIKVASDYDIIHVHSLYKIIPDLHKKYRDKKIVLHYHGSEVRGKGQDSIREEAEKRADIILGSTQDLKEYVSDITHVPNPVDTEHFTPKAHTDDRAFTVSRSIADTQWMLEYLKRNNINLEVKIVERDTKPIPYSEMPAFLKQFGIYIDIKYIDGMLLESLSKTGLESLACGLRVLDYELKYLQKLPVEHDPDKVANQIISIYDAISH